MSKWIRGIYNAAANFNMRNALQSARGRTLGGNNEHMRKVSNQSDQRVESSESIESSGVTSSTCTPATCTCARTSARNGYRIPCKCTATPSVSATQDRSVIVGNDVIITDAIERDYNEYINYTISASREDISTWVRVSNEPRDFKPSNDSSENTVERCTGIPTGVTV
jgi:hypothetical protein